MTPKPDRYHDEVRALSQRVRRLRYERGWTLEQTAEKMDIDLTHLQRIEAGALNVTFLTLTRLAHGFGVAMWALFLDPSGPYGGANKTLPTTDPQDLIDIADCPQDGEGAECEGGPALADRGRPPR